MLVLLDEKLPQRLRFTLHGHDVRTTVYQGWSGLTNGALLRAAEEAGFEVLVTADKSMQHQQNMKRSLALVVLSTNERSVVMRHGEEILKAIEVCSPGNVQFVDLGG